MEVKIKNSDNTLVDADWTIKDGVMVVSSKESFNPKNGDMIAIWNRTYEKWMPAIVQDVQNGTYVVHAMINCMGILRTALTKVSKHNEDRYATELEKTMLLNELQNEGLTWDDDKKMIFKRKFEPKEGDIIFVKASFEYVIIYKKLNFLIGRYAGVNIINGNLHIHKNGALCSEGMVREIRPATEEEKKLLFDKLAEEGYSWDAEKKELIELKWVLKDGDYYYYPACVDNGFVPLSTRYSASSSYDTGMAAKGWCFKTQQKCKIFCDRLNEAISEIKP